MSSELLLGEGKKPDYGAQIGVPGSVSNWDSSSTPQSVGRAAAAAPQVYRAQAEEHIHTHTSEGHLSHAPITPIDKEVMSARGCFS